MNRSASPSGATAQPPSRAAYKIMAAAAEAFSANGYGGTSTRDIASRLNMSPAAMYPHFATKEELLFAISLDGHRRALGAVSTAAAETPSDAPAAVRLAATVGAFTRWQAENNSIARVLQYEIRSLKPEHYREIIELRRDLTAVIEETVASGIASSEFRSGDPSDVALVLTSLCVDVCRWFPSSQHRDVDQLVDLYAGIAMRLVT